MVKARENTAAHNVHQYLVVGRATPTEKNPSPKIYKMRIFANDSVRAKSKFWYFLKRLNKIRKVVGEILSVNEIFEKDPSKVKTYGIVCTYKSKFGYHTLYKEFRSTTLNGAVSLTTGSSSVNRNLYLSGAGNWNIGGAIIVISFNHPHISTHWLFLAAIGAVPPLVWICGVKHFLSISIEYGKIFKIYNAN